MGSEKEYLVLCLTFGLGFLTGFQPVFTGGVRSSESFLLETFGTYILLADRFEGAQCASSSAAFEVFILLVERLKRARLSSPLAAFETFIFLVDRFEVEQLFSSVAGSFFSFSFPPAVGLLGIV